MPQWKPTAAKAGRVRAADWLEMNCPYCNKFLRGMTGFQEIENFRKHLNRCGKSPARHVAKALAGTAWNVNRYDLKDALEIRASSGQ
jgi:hypothetical protein